MTSLSENLQHFNSLVSERMQRFQILLNKAQFGFKQYQYDGVEWCVRNELRPDPPGNARGGFIADEMGLGKTLMMIGTMFVNFLSRTLIILPPVLLPQWEKEIFKASGHKALIYYGKNKKKITDTQLCTARIVLTTYNAIMDDDCPIKKINWNRVIFDEAHHLRNSDTKRYHSCKQIRARIRWLVSGTPIQNKKQDFYNLCSAAGMKADFYINPTNIKIIGKHFILRRTKAQVGINLPEVNKQSCVVNWSNINEKNLAEEIHALLPAQTKVPESKRKKLADIFGPGGALVAILRARQTCIMPSLMRKNIDSFKTMGFVTNEYEEALSSNSKMDAVISLALQRKDNNKGKIIFCHYKAEIDFIADKLREGGMKRVVTYDGRNSGGKNLRDLAEPADALVIQIQTGCEGLNLQQHFSEIYFVSPHWNPAVEDQAIARCHRIGQNLPVDVFKFEMQDFDTYQDVTSITLEKYVNFVQDMKRNISTQILNEVPDT